MDDEIAAWLRKQAELDRAAAEALHEPAAEIARAEPVLAVLDAYETARKLAEAAWDQEDEAAHSLGDQARGLRRAVRLLAYGYRRREGWQDGWKA